ncbi:HNH endonuclease [Rhodococcus sp. NPDC059969]|uniref:HNH endonuclease n=1 Tax=Rhodococcus sp. NPDC059969 TaxID=3347018 RepID=UPI003670BDA6
MSTPSSARRRALKAALAERDGSACFYCATQFGPGLDGSTLDHLVPRSRWSTWAVEALVLACEPCNRAKDDSAPALWLRPAVRFAPGLVPLESAG